ncbi:MAG: hypothetical protein EXR72_12320 [Myxococcales bacterium]|nr:hypothetical protein [Myxococcales bacterium]
MTSPIARVAEFALTAAEYVRRALAVELDGSTESLAFVDHYISHTVRKGGEGDVADELLELIAPALGAYFGEVVTARLGGTWHALSENPADWTITLATPSGTLLCTFHPVGMAAQAIRGGDIEEYDASVTAPRELSGPLADALAAVSPVAADYFYSLTGRLESLEHIVDLLVELDRARDGGRAATAEDPDLR